MAGERPGEQVEQVVGVGVPPRGRQVTADVEVDDPDAREDTLWRFAEQVHVATTAAVASGRPGEAPGPSH